MYDVIVVGARCAGSPLAMLLARKGYRVLAVDRACFPSPTVSTHMMLPPGGAALGRWGILDAVMRTGPACSRVCLNDFPGGRLLGPWHKVDGIDYTINVRRFKLDRELAEQARRSGAEIREGVQVSALLTDGDRVTGIKGRDLRSGTEFRERARIVVGADGRRSFVARRVRAREYNAVPPLTVNFFAYVDDLASDPDVVEIYSRPPREFLFVPTDDGLTIANLVMSRSLFDGFRNDVDGNFYAAFDQEPALGARLRNCRLASPIYGAINLANFYRQAHGPGWALVGDARHSRDPIRAQGMHEAFEDVESLADALDLGLSGEMPMDAALDAHERDSNRRTSYPYRLCLQAARLSTAACDESDHLMMAIKDDPLAIADFRGLMAGSVDPRAFYERMSQLTVVRGEILA